MARPSSAATCRCALKQYADANARFDAVGTTSVDLVYDRCRLPGRGLADDALDVVEQALVARPLLPREEADLLVAVAEAALAADDWDRRCRLRTGLALLRASPVTSIAWRQTSSSITARDRAGAATPARLLRRAERARHADARGAGAPSCRRPSSSVQARRAGSGRARAAALAAGWLAEAADYRRASTGSERALGWLAQASARELAGDAGGVLRACELGLRALDEHRATLGSQELRAGSVGPRCGPGRARYPDRMAGG